MSNNIEENSNLFNEWIKEREAMLNRVPLKERKRIEKEINVFLKAMFLDAKTKGGQFFKYKPILENEHIKKHFNIITTAGDRNIGKSTSSHEEMKRVVDAGRRFIMMRNIQDEIKHQIKSDGNGWMSDYGWLNDASQQSPEIVRIVEDKKKKGKAVKQLIGWYRDLNTIGKFKSIEFQETDLLVYEEYNSEVIGISDKWRRFSEFITTVQRHNNNLKILMQANYVHQNDVMLQKLGIGLTQLSKDKYCIINWIVGAIVIFIPKDTYKSTGETLEEKSNKLGYRTSLADYETWNKQYGGTFISPYTTNVINDSDIGVVEHAVCNMAHSTSSKSEIMLTLYKAYDRKGEVINFFSQKMGENNAPVFVFDSISEMKHINAIKLDSESLENFISAWKSNKIKTSSSEVYDSLTRIFGKAKSVIDRSEFKIEEIPDFI